jgi:hypothetical protein
MPSVTLHLLLAERTMAALEGRATRSPFDVRLPHIRNAFRQGALGPDLGYFPGGHRFLSDLAHCVAQCRPDPRAGARGEDGARARVRLGVGDARARRPTSPSVDRARGGPAPFPCGRRVHFGRRRPRRPRKSGDRTRRVDLGPPSRGGSNKVAAGLRPLVRAVSQPVLSAKLRRRPGPELFLASHAATTRVARWALFAATDVMGREIVGKGTRSALKLARSALAGMSKRTRVRRATDSISLAYFTPVRPEPWLLAEVGEEVAGFSRRYLELASDGFAGLENRNLDTGEADALESALAEARARGRPPPSQFDSTVISKSPPAPDEKALTMIR